MSVSSAVTKLFDGGSAVAGTSPTANSGPRSAAISQQMWQVRGSGRCVQQSPGGSAKLQRREHARSGRTSCYNSGRSVAAGTEGRVRPACRGAPRATKGRKQQLKPLVASNVCDDATTSGGGCTHSKANFALSRSPCGGFTSCRFVNSATRQSCLPLEHTCQALAHAAFIRSCRYFLVSASLGLTKPRWHRQPRPPQHRH